MIIVVLVKKNSDKMITVMEVVRWLRSDYSGIYRRMRCGDMAVMRKEMVVRWSW